MSKKLTKREINALYGVEPGKEVLAFGARISNKPAKRAKRELTYDEIRHFKPAQPAAAELVSDVIEKNFI